MVEISEAGLLAWQWRECSNCGVERGHVIRWSFTYFQTLSVARVGLRVGLRAGRKDSRTGLILRLDADELPWLAQTNIIIKRGLHHWSTRPGGGFSCSFNNLGGKFITEGQFYCQTAIFQCPNFQVCVKAPIWRSGNNTNTYYCQKC